MKETSTTQKKRCLIHVRVSTEKQDAENQVIALEEYAKRRGWEIVLVVRETISGGESLRKRPRLREVFDLAHKRKFDVLLVWALDRLSREGVSKTLGYIERLEEKGVGFVSYQEEHLDTLGPFRYVVLALYATLAKQERLKIIERTKAGLERAKRKGRVGGRPRLSIPAETREKAVQLHEEGLSLRKIEARLKELGLGGYSTRDLDTGKKFSEIKISYLSYRTIGTILHNEAG